MKKVHQDIIEIFGEDSNDILLNILPPVQTSEQFLNEHEDDVIYVHEIPNEDGCVLTIENPEEVICTGQSLLDEQQMELNNNENKEEVSCTKGVVAIEEQEAGVKCEKEVAVTPDEPSLHWDILTPPPAEKLEQSLLYI